MTSWFAIVFDVWRHLWRMKAPAAVGAMIVLVMLSLPFILASDGSLDGKCKLFLLYAANCQSAMLCVITVFLAVFLEHKERKSKVRLMMAISPVSRLCHVSAKCAALFATAMLFTGVSSLAVAGGFEYLIRHIEKDPRVASEARCKLGEVQEKKALRPIESLRMGAVRVKGREIQAGMLPAGEPLRFNLVIKKTLNEPKLEGMLQSVSSKDKALLNLSLFKDGKRFWARSTAIESGKRFGHLLPHDLFELSPLELEIAQINPEGKLFFFNPKDPFTISSPRGSYLENLAMALSLFAVLALVLVAMTVFCCQFVSAQVGLLLSATVSMLGLFRTDIAELIFYLSGPASAAKTLDWVDMLYAVIWKPLLGILPDLSVFNPASRLVNGEWISWPVVLEATAGVLPHLAFIFMILAYALPRQELEAPS